MTEQTAPPTLNTTCPDCGGQMDPCKGGLWMCNDTLCYAFGDQHAARVAALPTPPSDAGTSERETGIPPTCEHCGHLTDSEPISFSLTFGDRVYPMTCNHAAAPAAEGPRPEAATCPDCPHPMHLHGDDGCHGRKPEGDTGPWSFVCGCVRTNGYHAAALPGAEAGTPDLVDGYDATFWRDSYRILTAALDEHLADCIQEDDVAEEAIYEDAIVQAGRRLAALTSEVRTLRADKARLDWMQEHAAEAFPVFDMDPEAEIGYRVKSEETLDAGEGAQLRAAIDAARLASPSPTGAPSSPTSETDTTNDSH